MVAQRRSEREAYVAEASGELASELEKAGIQAEISSRAKHFYSIYEKMVKRGKEFNEIYDLTAMRVIAEREGARAEATATRCSGSSTRCGSPCPVASRTTWPCRS